MTPARSYRVEYGESLGTTVQRMLAEEALISHSEQSEYADVGAKAVETVAQATPPSMIAVRRALGRLRDWVRSRYGLREIILPEKYPVDARHEVFDSFQGLSWRGCGSEERVQDARQRARHY